MKFVPLFLASLVALAAADPLPPGGKNLIARDAEMTAHAANGGRATRVEITGANFPTAMRIIVATATPDQPWNAQLALPLDAGEIKTGDKLLVSYMARRVDGGHGAAVGKAQLKKPDYTMIGMTETSEFGTEWERVNLPFVAQLDAPAGRADFVLFFGDQVQTVEIAAVQLTNYGPDIDLATLPRQRKTYVGREADAPWRAAALARIAKVRQADHALVLTGADGEILPRTEVTVELHRHEFGFGSCVSRGMLTRAGPDGERYREIVARTFSSVVFENDLKPGLLPADETGLSELERSFAWLKENEIAIRGHYLMQEAVDEWSRERISDPEKLRSEVLASVVERVSRAGNRVAEWDAINHPVAWTGAELLGDHGPPLDTLAIDVLKKARELTDLPMLVNEDQLFRPGPQQDKTFEYLRKLKNDGVRIDGLGNQAHFHASFLPSPDDLLRVTDRFAAVVPKQVVTEFDIVTNGDESLAADYLRDCLIACFSHPAYDGFLLWGFWEDAHWIPEAALWKKDWSPRPIARVWEKWVGERWNTRVTLTSDDAGIVRWRGFKGSYRVTRGAAVSEPVKPGPPDAPVRTSLR